MHREINPIDIVQSPLMNAIGSSKICICIVTRLILHIYSVFLTDFCHTEQHAFLIIEFLHKNEHSMALKFIYLYNMHVYIYIHYQHRQPLIR
jgi:hypothetical protein